MNMKNENTLLSRLFGATRTARASVMAVVLTAVLLAALMVLNLLVGLIPSSVTLLDTTQNKQFAVSDTSLKFVRALKEDVTIYVLAPTDAMSPTLEAILSRYQAASRHIKVELVDVSRDTEIIEKYAATSLVGTYSMIVASERRYRLVDSANFDYYTIEGLGMNFTPYEYDQFLRSDSYLQIAYAYYNQYGVSIDSVTHRLYRAEEAISQAIDFVTAETIPHVYVAKGHNEAPLGEMFLSFIEQVGLICEDINLRDVTSLPADVATLVIHAPKTDLTDEETNMILSFMEGGGNVLLITDGTSAALPNLMRIAGTMGLAPMAGVIHEGNANRFDTTDTNIKPAVNDKHTITASGVESGYVMLMPNSHGIAVDAKLPENVTVTSLLTTSDSAYVADADGKETTLGAVSVGVAAQNSKTGAKLVWYSSVEAFADSAVEKNSGNALYYLAMTLYWQNKTYQSTLPAIKPVELTRSIMAFNSFSAILLSIVLVIFIPVAALVIGISIRMRRKRR
jgi:ABC-2 type transport system permease protein